MAVRGMTNLRQAARTAVAFAIRDSERNRTETEAAQRPPNDTLTPA